ncbi:MAG: DUF1990 family protein [Pseudonocardia sp.]
MLVSQARCFQGSWPIDHAAPPTWWTGPVASVEGEPRGPGPHPAELLTMPSGGRAGRAIPRGYQRAVSAELTYPEVGATRGVTMPPGYDHLERRVRLGRGPDVFDEARRQLLNWAMQRRCGATIHPPDTPPAEGLTVFVGLGLGPSERVPRIIQPAARHRSTGHARSRRLRRPKQASHRACAVAR